MFRHRKWNLCLFRTMSSEVRVRFAPSPTGQLHIGGFRTAIYNYLFAKKYQGKFILRLEDTDQERLVPGAAELMEQTLSWGQLIPDESPLKGGSFGPYTQSERLNFYTKAADDLLKGGFAYRCFCTEKRLELLRKEAARNRVINKYDGHCRHLTSSEIDERLQENRPYVIRFMLEKNQNVEFDDMIYGPVRQTVIEGDPIMMKSDGYPTYHLANVVDDHYMEISHVLRGFEWQTSTWKHVLLYKAFGWDPPKYGHLPLIMNPDGTKLSKRQGDVHVEHYKSQGYYSKTILNFALTGGGGGFGNDKIRDIDEMIEDFDVEKIRTNFSGLNFDYLDTINKSVMKELMEKNPKMVTKEMVDHLAETFGQVLPDVSDEVLFKLVDMERISKVSDLTANPDLQFLWQRPNLIFDNENDGFDLDTTVEIVNCIKQNQDEFKEANSAIRKLSKKKKIPYSKVMQYIRKLLSGRNEGPPVKEMIELLGKEETIIRLQHGIAQLNKRA